MILHKMNLARMCRMNRNSGQREAELEGRESLRDTIEGDGL